MPWPSSWVQEFTKFQTHKKMWKSSNFVFRLSEKAIWHVFKIKKLFTTFLKGRSRALEGKAAGDPTASSPHGKPTFWRPRPIYWAAAVQKAPSRSSRWCLRRRPSCCCYYCRVSEFTPRDFSVRDIRTCSDDRVHNKTTKANQEALRDVLDFQDFSWFSWFSWFSGSVFALCCVMPKPNPATCTKVCRQLWLVDQSYTRCACTCYHKCFAFRDGMIFAVSHCALLDKKWGSASCIPIPIYPSHHEILHAHMSWMSDWTVHEWLLWWRPIQFKDFSFYLPSCRCPEAYNQSSGKKSGNGCLVKVFPVVPTDW